MHLLKFVQELKKMESERDKTRDAGLKMVDCRARVWLVGFATQHKPGSDSFIIPRLSTPGDVVARIDIEETFWIDIISVAVEMGNTDLAIGNALRFFRFAQEKAKHRAFLTEEEFDRADVWPAVRQFFNESIWKKTI